MLSPNDGDWIPLLPQDRQIMEITGMDEKQYRAFMRETMLRHGIKPGDPVAFDLISFAVVLIIGIVLSALSSLLFRKPQPKQPEYETNTVQGQDIQNSSRFTPTSGFDSVQNVVELGSTVPLVYTNRQEIDGIAYGGVRVNTNLLWSQLYSIGGGQLLRALFLIGEGTIPQLDVDQFAIGNNIIGSYKLESTEAGRISLYYSPDGGRITSSDYVAGLRAGLDPGNAENAGATDVFQARGAGMAFGPNFCFTSTPSNQTVFGLYGHLGNNFGLKPNPSLRPQVSLSSDSDGNVICPLDRQERGQRTKQGRRYPGRSGIVGASDGERIAEVDENLTFKIFQQTDGNGFFTIPVTTGTGAPATVSLNDVGSTIASRQNSYDDNLSIGELYRVGSAMAICTSRTNKVFVSDIESTSSNAGQTVEANFRVVRRGVIAQYTESRLNPATYNGDIGENPPANAVGLKPCSRNPQIFRCAESSFATERVGQVVELGLRSNLGLDVNGLANFGDCIYSDNGTLRTRTYEIIDGQACEDYEGDGIDGVSSINYQNGTYQSPETQYSFFIIAYREAATDDVFTEFNPFFGIRGQGGTNMYNYLRFDFGEEKRWEFRLTPVSSWEVRSSNKQLQVLDYRSPLTNYNQGNATIQYNGAAVNNRLKTFALPVTRTIGSEDIGTGFDDFVQQQGFYVDAYARLAEAFIYSEVTSTAVNNPAHQIVYINTVTKNNEIPNYDNLALVGMNIRSSKEITQLSQFSVYVNQGIGSTSNFPEILYDLLSNKRYGTGKIVSLEQIDKAAFDYCSEWAANRKYFFDGAVSEKLNIRSWASETATNFMLEFVIRNGKFSLQPVANFDGPETVTGLYTAGNIIEDSFALNYFDEQARIPPRVSVKWREERQSTAVDNKGLFPVVREVTVREATTDEDAPLEQIDLSGFCTSLEQAIDRGKWECRSRRLVTHGVTFKTTPTQITLDIGAVFKLGLETFSYDQPSNGAVDAAGNITSWPALSDGSYPVLYWDGTAQTVTEQTMVIANGKTAPGPAVFSIKTAYNDAQTYRTQALSFDENGNIDVEASYFPTGEDYISELVRNWDDASKWIIEGDQS